MPEAPALCIEAGRLLGRAALLGVNQADAACDLVERVAQLVERAPEQELREKFLPPLLATLGQLNGGEPIIGWLDDAAKQGGDAMRSAVACLFRTIPTMGE